MNRIPGTMRAFSLLFALVLAVQPLAKATSIKSPERTQGLVINPVNFSTHTLVNLSGKGCFVAARVSKQGGPTDLTFVRLSIDGKNVVDISVAALANLGTTASNPFGIVLQNSGATVETVTIGFPQALVFKTSLVLDVVVNENGVVQIIGNVVSGVCSKK